MFTTVANLTNTLRSIVYYESRVLPEYEITKSTTVPRVVNDNRKAFIGLATGKSDGLDE